MSNYTKIGKVEGARTELHDLLGLTGAEISYFILSGRGKAVIDDEEVALSEGDWVRIAPEGRRQFFASSDSPVTYICIQVKAGSLGAYTADDAL